MNLSYLQVAIQAAIEGGKAIMEVYATAFDVHIKEDQSPLTLADTSANAIIIDYLKKTTIPIISEENRQSPYEERKDWTRCWIVDPLDGTKEFIHRNGEFTVNIALVENGIPVLGVIYIPVSQTLYFTSCDGQTASRYSLNTDTESSVQEIISKAVQIRPALKSEPIKIVGSRSHFNDETKLFIAAIEQKKKVNIVARGSSLKFCVIAEGGAHLYPRFAPTMEWDTAAGHAICRAVGVEVINQETQQPLLYNKENLLNPSFVVSCEKNFS